VTAAVLGRLQGGLEQLYRVATGLPVEAFLIDDAARATLGLARAPREQLVVVECDDGIDVGLFVDRAVLANLAAYDPGSGLDDRNLPAFLAALEGRVASSTPRCARRGARAVSALEPSCRPGRQVRDLPAGDAAPGASAAWRARLYEQHSYEPDSTPTSAIATGSPTTTPAATPRRSSAGSSPGARSSTCSPSYADSTVCRWPASSTSSAAPRDGGGGSSTVNVEPTPTALTTAIVPPSASTSRLTSARPSPTPP
jgi:hypothetical protein